MSNLFKVGGASFKATFAFVSVVFHIVIVSLLFVFAYKFVEVRSLLFTPALWTVLLGSFVTSISVIIGIRAMEKHSINKNYVPSRDPNNPASKVVDSVKDILEKTQEK